MAVLALLATVPACTAGPLGQHHQVGQVKLAIDLPLSGDDAVDGVPVLDAINLALSGKGSVCGASSHADACVAVQSRVMDDVSHGIHDPARAAQNLEGVASDQQVVGVVGALYDSLARSEIPAADRAGLALLSPANSDDCLTVEPPDGRCQGLTARLRPSRGNTYFRVVTTQAQEPIAAADLCYKTLGKRHAFVVNDESPLGRALTTAFKARFAHDGGKIVEDEAGADVIYFPGSDLPAVAGMRRQMTSPAQVPLVGSDALSSDQFARDAGTAARGTYYTVVGPDPQHTRSAANFVHDYSKRFGRQPGPTSLAAFDATGVLLAAIARAIDEAGGSRPSRKQVLEQLRATSDYPGAMGVFGFDQQGDTTLRWVSAFQWLSATDLSGRFTAQFAVG